MRQFIYLHGLASGPQSAKAKYLRDRFKACGLSLTLPDFNEGGFKALTLTRQIQQVEALLETTSPSAPSSTILIGSSLGGLTAAWVAERNPQVERILLLAPAFEFLQHWSAMLGPEAIALAQQEGYRLVFHYGFGHPSPLGWQFVTDLQQYPESGLRRSLPMLILHGRQDAVIPIEASRRFAAERPWVTLRELESDHALGNSSSKIWQAVQEFCWAD